MATPSTKPGVNGVSSPGGSTPSHTRDWGALRNGEPGSAFRGLTKGRGGDRGGRRGGRGGRGSRAGGGSSPGGRGGGDQVNATKPEPNPAKVNVPTESKPAHAAGASTSPAEKGTTPTATNEKTPKPKGSSRKSSRNVPTLILPSSSPIVETAPAAAPARQANRRRRSQQRGKSPITASSPKLSVDPSPNPNLLRPQRARTGPPSPVISTKDAPLHLSAGPTITTFDMKHNIDALVERVRAVAMDNNRPTTPGSHIDWAGDDDDSLPDLDDWGVTTSTSIAEDRIEISPILVDGLKPLPEPTVRLDNDQEKKEVSTAPVVDVVPQMADKAPPQDDKWKSNRFPRTLQVDSKANVCLKPMSSTDTTAYTASAPEPTNVRVPAHVSPTNSSEPLPKAPLHPSLPAKPVAAVQNLVQAKIRPGAMPMRVSVPVKQPVIVDKSPEPTQPPVAAVEKTASPVEQPSKTSEKPLTSVVTDALPQLIMAPPTAEPSPEVNSSTENSSDKAGLAASIHAPVSLPESASSLNLAQPIPTAPRAFNPTHQRAHTVGRVQQFNQLQTPPGFQQRFSRSGTSTPRGGYDTHMHVTHSRTHSSPPTGSGLNPRIHTQRPVITVDAISRLARTIGGIPPPRAKEVPITKEN